MAARSSRDPPGDHKGRPYNQSHDLAGDHKGRPFKREGDYGFIARSMITGR